jgi:hypothetical protein
MLENFARAVGEARALVRGEHSTANDKFVHAVVEENVQNTIEG